MADETQQQQSTPIPGSTDISSQFPNASRIENGIAYDIKGNKLGAVKGMESDQGDQPPEGFTEKPVTAQPPAGFSEKPVAKGDQPPEGFTEKPVSTLIPNAADALIPEYLRNDPKFQSMTPEQRKEILARHGRSTAGKGLNVELGHEEAQKVHSDSIRDTVADFFENVKDGAAGSFTGGVEGAAKMAATGLRKLGADKLADEISSPTGTGLFNNLATGDERARGVGGAVGVAADNVLEFFAGDEALKALGEGMGLVRLFGKEKLAAQIARWAKVNPFKAATLSAAITGLRQGTVSGVQSLAHGADTKTAAWNALFSAGLGSLFDSFGSMAQSASQGVRVAGKVGSVATGTGLAADSLYDALRPQQEGESEQDAINRRVSAAAGMVMSADAIGEGIKSDAEVRRYATDKVKNFFGATTDPAEALQRSANMLGKKEGAAFLEKARRVQDDVQAIVREADKEGGLKTPKDAAKAIDDHLREMGDKPLQEKAKETADSTDPVVPNFRQRLNERLEEFFKENDGFYTDEEKERLRDEIHERTTKEHDLGNGATAPKEPNLFQAEGMRKRFNEDAFGARDQDSPRAKAMHEAAAFMREVIDEGYENRGVTGVKEFRQKQKDLIDVRTALEKVQSAYEKDSSLKSTWSKLASIGQGAGILGTIAAHFLGSDIIGGIIAAHQAWKGIRDYNVKDLHGNFERVKKLAAKSTGEAATPGFGGPEMEGPQPAPPGYVPPKPPEFPTTELGPKLPPAGTPPVEGPVNVPPGFAPPPEPPAPVQPPDINHKLYGTLSTFFREWVGDVPYDVLLQRFEDHFKNIKTFINNSADPNYQGPKYTPEQVQKADRIQKEINDSRAKDNEYVQKQNASNAAKHEKAMREWNVKLKAENERIAAEGAVQQEKIRAAAEQKKKEDVANLLADERIAHSVMKATEQQVDLGETDTHSSDMIHGHEHGHIMAYAAEGLQPIELYSGEHPLAQEQNAMASLRVDHGDMEEGAKGLAQRVVGMLGGAAFDEVHQNVSLARNTGARGDVRKARAILREEGGLTADETNKIFDALYERAKEHVQNPEALAIVNANKSLRESGLHKNWLISPGRMDNYVKMLQGVYSHGETPRTPGGTVQGTASGRDTGPANAGGEGSKQNVVAGRVSSQEGGEAGAARGKEGGEANSATKATERTKTGGGTKAVAGGSDDVAEFNPGKPKERSTGDEKVDAAIKEGGAVPGGVQKGFEYKGKVLPASAYFHDPLTGTSLNLPMDQVTAEAVKNALRQSRKAYGIEEGEEEPEMERLRRTGPGTREAIPPTQEEIEGARERQERREAERRVEAQGLFKGKVQAEQANFQKPETNEWFKGSKVVDEKGEPLRVYHGTRSSEDFQEFSTEGPPYTEAGDRLSSGSGYDPTSFMGAHFAVEPDIANKFATPPKGSWMATRYEGEEEKPRVIPAYLSLKNPKNFGLEENLRNFIYKTGKIGGYAGDELLNRAMEADGIHDPESGGDEVDKWVDRYENDPEFRREQNEWVMETYRPFDTGEDDLMREAAEDLAGQAKSELKKMGHDGIKYKNQVEGGTAYTAFEPDQIRHAIPEGNPKENTEESEFSAYSPEEQHVLKTIDSKYPVVGEKVDGRVVREDVPNLDSISASLAPNYHVLADVREIPMSDFEDQGSATKRTQNLAGQIKESGELNPLIVGYDHRGPWILEGGHRFDALRILGAKSFPAVVAVDLNEGFVPKVAERGRETK